MHAPVSPLSFSVHVIRHLSRPKNQKILNTMHAVVLVAFHSFVKKPLNTDDEKGKVNKEEEGQGEE